jgi:hypothetical protein
MSIDSQDTKPLSAPGSFHGLALFDVFSQGNLGLIPAREGPLVDCFAGSKIPFRTNIEESAGSKWDRPGFTLAMVFHDWSSFSPPLFKGIQCQHPAVKVKPRAG